LKTDKNLHLILSAIIITIVALAYGLLPNTVLSKLFSFTVQSTDLKQVFRAAMGLYLGMALLWVIGIFKPVFWRTATIANIFFMGGLAAGRIFGLLTDGIPSIYFSIDLVLELIFAIWGIINLKKYRKD